MTLTDGFPTLTSVAQTETELILQDHMPQSSYTSKPVLEKKAHMQFLVRHFIQGFPARYTSQDASQPWLMFWTLQSFSTLQVVLDPGNKRRAIHRLLACQHHDGGFGGGPGQSAHLLPTYAAVCTLAIVGGPGPNGGWDQIDREKMYDFFMSLKQKDGSFHVTRHGEVDVRGIYCLIVTAILLDLITPELVEGTAEFVASCQTYEGGFSSASHPSFSPGPTPTLLNWPQPSLGEAHGGYTFCSLASWVALQPIVDYFRKVFGNQPSINIPNLTRWVAQMQGRETELGGFRGRTNKLVDGCYSWWCGGSFTLLEALDAQNQVGSNPEYRKHAPTATEHDHHDDTWSDIDDCLYDREALQRYILFAGQHPAGGLRDKPPKNADAYHTLYCLSGLSSAQHHVIPSAARRSELSVCWSPSPRPGINDDLRKNIFLNMLYWTEVEADTKVLGGSANRLNATHPITNLTISHTENIMAYFYGQTIPPRRVRKPGNRGSS
ncbi:hypothetical protein APHAL10511_000450 [Amanita phalloides]|nr:hypothetical protein APHAL10511_000450 [Amanita phalloides]